MLQLQSVTVTCQLSHQLSCSLFLHTVNISIARTKIYNMYNYTTLYSMLP